MSVQKILPPSFFGANQLKAYIKSIDGVVWYGPGNDPAGATVMKNRAPATRGTLDGVASSATPDIAGQSGKSWRFDGINDFILVSNPPINIREFSIFWIAYTYTQPTPNDGWQDWWGLLGAAGGLLVAEIEGTNGPQIGSPRIIRIAGFTGATDLSLQQDVRNAGWFSYCIAASAIANESKFYVNETLVETDVWAPASQLITQFRIGERQASSSRDIKADMQHFVVANRPFTQEEVTNMNLLAGLT